MDKKKIAKTGKIIIITITLILVIMCIAYFARNYIIISKLAKAQNDFHTSNNYSYVFETDNGGKSEYYYKDGKSLEIWKNENNNIICKYWKDKNTQERIIIDYDKSTATITPYREGMLESMVRMNSTIVPNNIKDKINRAFIFFLSTKEIDGKEYYHLQPLRGVISTRYCFNKEDGRISKIMSSSAVEYKDYKLNEVTDEDVKRPDLTGYTVTDNR